MFVKTSSYSTALRKVLRCICTDAILRRTTTLFWQSIKQRYRWSLGSLRVSFSTAADQRCTAHSKGLGRHPLQLRRTVYRISAIAFYGFVVAKFIEAGSLINAINGLRRPCSRLCVEPYSCRSSSSWRKRWPGDWKAVLCSHIYFLVVDHYRGCPLLSQHNMAKDGSQRKH